MNIKYIQKKNLLISRGEFLEELETQDYKAALKQRVAIQLNSGTTVFSLPLFLSDYYTLDSKKPLSKDKLEAKINELAVFEGQQLKPMEAYSKLYEDFLSESIKYKDYVKQEAEKLISPNRDDFAKDEDGKDEYDRAFFLYGARKQAKITRESEDVLLIKQMLLYFKPNTKIIFGFDKIGLFLGYKIVNTSTKFKYTKGSIQFYFAFLQYPLIALKLSSNLEDLVYIKNESIRYFTSTRDKETGKELSNVVDNDIKKIDDWRPTLNRRIVRRFFAGNILSGIVEATKQKKEGKFNTWSLTRFNNNDGSINTAIELKFDRELPKDTDIKVDNVNLSVSSKNTNLYSYLTKMIISLGYEFVTSDSYGYYRIMYQDIYPIWNIESDKICDRAICILKRSVNMYSSDEKKYKDIDVIEFEVVQSYILSELKQSRQKIEKARKVGEKMYNNLYYDQEFQDMFASHLITSDPEKRLIKYGFYTYQDGKGKTASKHNELKSYIKKYQFLQSDVNNINNFLGELYDRYEISFNFRSDVAEYYNIESQGDTFSESKKQQKLVFPISEYEYRFINVVSQNILEAIPNMIRKTNDGAYGGVILNQPLMPNILPSYSMKPYKFDNEIYVKLTLSILNDEDKSQFVKELENLADIQNADPYEIGEFVKSFLIKRTVGTIYFYGDLRISDYGKIFQEYALKQDLTKLIFDENEQAYATKEVKTQVNLDDAESFIIKLYSLI